MGDAGAAAGGEGAGKLDLFGQWQHVRIKPGIEQYLGRDFLGGAMRLGLGEQAGKAAENLKIGRHGGVVKRHVMLFSCCGISLRAVTACCRWGGRRVNATASTRRSRD